jgi:hypothetical protein
VIVATTDWTRTCCFVSNVRGGDLPGPLLTSLPNGRCTVTVICCCCSFTVRTCWGSALPSAGSTPCGWMYQRMTWFWT